MLVAEEPVDVVEEVVAEERVVHDTDTITVISTEPSVHTDGAFLGGPSDRFVLTGYADHVAYKIWQGEKRPVLKLTSHGSKLKNFPERPILEQVARIVRDFHLMDFAGCSLMMLDTPLLSAFVKRWHSETSSFHLPFGEMTMTLDDVHSLFHLLIAGTFFTAIHRDQATAVHMVMDALEFDELVVLKEFGDTRGFHLRMSWLRKVYHELADAGSDLDTPSWAWGVAALTMLYTALDAASRPDTRQLAGYLSLLHTQRYAAADPCASRWKARHALPGGVIEYRRKLDALTLDDVNWTPYTGYVRWESHVARHLPERCLHQYGCIQGIPRLVLETPTGCIDRWAGPSTATSDVPGPSGTRASSDPPPPLPPPAGDQDSRLQYIAVHLDSLMDLVNPDAEVYSILARLADVARGGPV
ncbi:protein MAIN-LIKE 1-like [Vicia villosa]|uniref:protein MAIN-LIKE 1-like n=1 Tax=Vicia villosa TaxID=3911 RepID=UPI00273C44B1|nr:protein MAIN-LIKE 1-like [Vicia villosa]